MLRKSIFAALLGAGVLCVSLAHAHGDAPPKHGGIVRSSQELTFELVTHDDSVVLYVDDHGEELSTENLAGKLTVQNASGQSEADLKPAGGNKLEAHGVKVVAGDKVVAKLTTADGQPRMTVRFVAK